MNKLLRSDYFTVHCPIPEPMEFGLKGTIQSNPSKDRLNLNCFAQLFSDWHTDKKIYKSTHGLFAFYQEGGGLKSLTELRHN